MSKILFTLVLVFFTSPVFTQTYNMKIEQGTSSTLVPTTSIDKIRFLNSTVPFNCGDAVLYGGETYQTVLIGSQCWFQKNLNIGTRVDGVNDQTDNGTIEKYCYDNMDVNCTTHGGLYQWNEAMQYSTTEGTQGICPAGWHIPTDTELQTLSSAVSGSCNALKARGQAGIGTNTSGFSALLAGFRDVYNGGNGGLGSFAFFWSSTENGASNAVYILLGYDTDDIYFYTLNKTYGFSIRCLKD